MVVAPGMKLKTIFIYLTLKPSIDITLTVNVTAASYIQYITL